MLRVRLVDVATLSTPDVLARQGRIIGREEGHEAEENLRRHERTKHGCQEEQRT
jgi:hypothetical protein